MEPDMSGGGPMGQNWLTQPPAGGGPTATVSPT